MEASVTTLDPYRIQSPRRALVLGATAGYVDIVGFVMFFGLFAAYMSGNTALAGRDLGSGEFETALTRLIPMLAFVGFALLAFTVTHMRLRRGRTTLRLLLAIEAVMLAVAMLIGTHWYDDGTLRPESLEYYVVALIAVGAMAFQAVAVRRVAGTGVRTTFITAMPDRRLPVPARSSREWAARGPGSVGGGEATPAKDPAPFPFGAAAPDAVLDPELERVLEAGGLHGTVGADLPGSVDAHTVGREEHPGRAFAAQGPVHPGRGLVVRLGVAGGNDIGGGGIHHAGETLGRGAWFPGVLRFLSSGPDKIRSGVAGVIGTVSTAPDVPYSTTVTIPSSCTSHQQRS